MLYGVRDQLVQIFLNLVLNAVDATENGGRITISAKSLPGIVRLEVSDNGAGIEPANTTYFVGALIPEGALVEVELDAVVDG